MLSTIRSAALAAAIVVGAGGIALADEHPYGLGTVWEVSYIETAPGKFEDYMTYLSTVWKPIQEAEKSAGRVVSYKVLSITDPRDGEADLVLMIERPNFATLDTPLEVQDAVMAQAFGSLPKADRAAADREVIRTLRGTMLTRELTLK